ncbi:hypothetical protein CDD82_372 [Ophiocordyceps australis]|uniref:GED domain-containing protein n=1 Tax=Ophiocordyceps australis TaxID=1399860 RepID=A0A2C5XRY1_9HYPO|nr:hypothetical protein CDD82_372 [Ophiocordyceps australis]
MALTPPNMKVSLDFTVLKHLVTNNTYNIGEMMGRVKLAGLGQLAKIPRIIAVGQPLAGKSSVLEAIFRIRLSISGDAASRFVTELYLHPASQTRIAITLSSLDASHPVIKIARSGFAWDDIPKIVKEATEIGRLNPVADSTKAVLRIELQYPKLQPLNFVDLPGGFPSNKASQPPNGKNWMDELVMNYMSQPNSIILAVVSATRNLADQVDIDMLKKFDPSLKRTMGIITRPDLSKCNSPNENDYMQLAFNRSKKHGLPWGWHVLCNNTHPMISFEERDAKERFFFATTAWKAIPSHSRDIFNLRRKLNRILEHETTNCLVVLTDRIETALRQRVDELTRLGKPRSSFEDMRLFMLNVAGEFQRLARDGIQGRYSDAFFGKLDDQDHKLRAQLYTFHRNFCQTMLIKGAKKVVPTPGESDQDNDRPSAYLQSFMDSSVWDFPNPQFLAAPDLRAELQRQAATNHGSEYSDTFGHELAVQFFREQLSPWQKIAQTHITQVVLAAKAFIDQLLRHVTENILGTLGTTEAILRAVVDPFFEKKEQAMQVRLQELIRPYSEGFAQPLDSDFRRVYSKRSRERLAHRFMNALEPHLVGDSQELTITRDMVIEALRDSSSLDALEPGVEDAIISAQSHYDISRRTFSENVVNLAIESCLISDLPNILTPAMVGCMASSKLKSLVGESAENQNRRTELRIEIPLLHQALQQCMKHQPRLMAALPRRMSSAGTSGTYSLLSLLFLSANDARIETTKVPAAANLCSQRITSETVAAAATLCQLETEKTRQVATTSDDSWQPDSPETVVKAERLSAESTPLAQRNTDKTTSSHRQVRSLSPSPFARMWRRPIKAFDYDVLGSKQPASGSSWMDGSNTIEEEAPDTIQESVGNSEGTSSLDSSKTFDSLASSHFNAPIFESIEDEASASKEVPSWTQEPNAP